ncbi:MAG: hypothetical protein GQ558_01035 [Thermoplasmata archaeon]|nr:hypothetical protein [Thermoplasmata archaeon]
MARTKSRRRDRGVDFDIPTILSSQEVLDKAFHKATKVTVEDKIAIHRARKTTMAKIDSIASSVDAVLQRVTKSFTAVGQLHPFYHEVLASQVDVDEVLHALHTVDWCRGQVKEVCRKAVRQVDRTRNREFVESKRREVYGRVSSLLDRISGELDLLATTRAILKSLPHIDPAVPTAVVAGSPNVGKSALAAIDHLTHVLIFLIDPSETCGTPVDEQEALLAGVQAHYSDAVIIVVETKADLERREIEGRVSTSAETGEGVEELRALLVDVLPKPEIEWVIREG